MAPESWGSGDI